MEQFILQNQWIIWLAVIWTLPWKAVALWRAAKLKHVQWFIVLLLVNTLGLLEILYIFIFSRKTARPENFTAEEAEKIGEKLGIDWSKFNIEQFRRGMDVELEHGLRDSHTNVTNDDALTTGKIALAHLNEFSDYYDRLEKLEEEAKKYWEK